MLLMDAPPEIPRWLAALEKRFIEPEKLTVFQKEWLASFPPREPPPPQAVVPRFEPVPPRPRW